MKQQLLPDFEACYRALVARDSSLDGRLFVGVASTGIFCRVTCPARRPKPENCRFFQTAAACLAAGFRACKRCSPLQPAALADPIVGRMLERYNQEPAKKWSENDVSQLGLDPSTVRRAFKRHFGMTFLEFARLERLHAGFTTLAGRGQVIEAQLDAGFESGSGFRRAFARLLGVAPGQLGRNGAVRADWIQTPLGHMIAVANQQRLLLLEFVDRKALPRELAQLMRRTRQPISQGRFEPVDQIESELTDYFSGGQTGFATPIEFQSTAFNHLVWNELLKIPAGELRSYAEIATAIKRPGSFRAVARANGANQLAIIVPCHRVIGSDGSLTGYGGGLWRKQKLIDLEQAAR